MNIREGTDGRRTQGKRLRVRRVIAHGTSLIIAFSPYLVNMSVYRLLNLNGKCSSGSFVSACVPNVIFMRGSPCVGITLTVTVPRRKSSI